MTSNSLVALAAGMRKALSSGARSSILDKAGREAKLDLMDMLPDLQRQLAGDRETIRDMVWSVSYPSAFKILELIAELDPESGQLTGNFTLEYCPTCSN